MTRTVPVGTARALGDRAVLVGVHDAASGRRLARAVVDAGEHIEVVCGDLTVLLMRRDDDVDDGSLGAAVDRVLGGGAGVARSRHPGGAADSGHEPGPLVTIPCRFDGPDVAEVCALARCTPAELVELLTGAPLVVAVVGFSPGFAYLDALPAPLDRVPRRADPRPVVPAGSVALANGRAAVYPTSSPGGWNLVGRTGVTLFSTDGPPYALLTPGARVHFSSAGPGDPVEPPVIGPPARSWGPVGRPVLEVVTPGLRAVVQDGGRRGVASAGVPGAGPADPVSFDLANLLCHNARNAGTLELTGGVARLRALAPCHVAVVGAAPDIELDGTPALAAHLLPLGPGQVLRVGPLRGGWRTYVAVAGGLLGPTLFGSCASDELTGLGAGPLGSGATLWAGAWEPPLGDHLEAGVTTDVTRDGAPVELRVVPGPHRELFVDDALDRLSTLVFRVQPESNRVGIRLCAVPGSSPDLLAPTVRHGALDSHGVVTGTVQVPPSGEPVVLGPDHATLGGYPVLAVVAKVDVGRLGQCAPGTEVRMIPVERAAAAAAYDVARRARDAAVVGHYPLAVR